MLRQRIYWLQQSQRLLPGQGRQGVSEDVEGSERQSNLLRGRQVLHDIEEWQGLLRWQDVRTSASRIVNSCQFSRLPAIAPVKPGGFIEPANYLPSDVSAPRENVYNFIAALVANRCRILPPRKTVGVMALVSVADGLPFSTTCRRASPLSWAPPSALTGS